MDRRSFLILCSLPLILSFSVSATAALIPAIAEYFGIPALTAGRLVWIYMLPYGVCALFWGPLTHAVSAKKILLAALGLFAVSAFNVAFARDFNQALLGRMGMGIAGSAFTPIALIIIGKEVSGPRRGKHLGFFFALSFLSGVAGIFLSGLLPWRAIYFIPFAGALGMIALTAYGLKEFAYKGPFKISYLATIRDHSARALFLLIFVSSFLYHSLQQWLGVYLAHEIAWQQFAISMVFTVGSLTAMLGES